MGPLASQLMPQLRDQNRLRLHFGQQKCGERPQFRRVLWQRFGDIQHGETIAKQAFYGNPKTAKPLIYPAVKGRHVRSGTRHLRRGFDPLDQILILLTLPAASPVAQG